MLITLYKRGEMPRKVPQIDSPGWLSDGWSLTPPVDLPVNSIEHAPDTKFSEEKLPELPKTQGQKISLNKALKGDFVSLPSVGVKAATKIMEARPFESLDEFQDKCGFLSEHPFNVDFKKVLPLLEL